MSRLVGLLVVFSLLAVLGHASCSPSDESGEQGHRSSPVEKAATQHLWSLFRGRVEKLEGTYAPTVRLLPGHEFTLSHHVMRLQEIESASGYYTTVEIDPEGIAAIFQLGKAGDHVARFAGKQIIGPGDGHEH